MSRIPGLLKALEFNEQSLPLVMGILNVTPDSFSDGGKFSQYETMRSQIELMIESGVDIIDVGGESTRPGADPVPLNEEIDRVLPAIELIRSLSDKAISVDTYKPEVMKAAIDLDVDMINDVNALQSNGALDVVAGANVPVCLMHKKGQPFDMQQAPYYDDVVTDVTDFLINRAEACEQAGLKSDYIFLDPGFGFGKTLKHNIALFQNMEQLTQLNYSLLVGVSRKRMIGSLAGIEADLSLEQRLCGSVSAAVVAAHKGAKIIRVHDVAETVQALRVAAALW